MKLTYDELLGALKIAKTIIDDGMPNKQENQAMSIALTMLIARAEDSPNA